MFVYPDVKGDGRKSNADMASWKFGQNENKERFEGRGDHLQGN